jgi:Tol biopolymer transport system component
VAVVGKSAPPRAGAGFGRALTVGLAGALIALILADPRLGAEPASRGEGRIAFTFGESGAEHPSQLAVMDADGKNRRALPFDDVHGGLSWSPDGRSIAFGLMAYKGRDGIYTINVDRRKYRRVVRNGLLPDWSPNGRSIAFERGRDIWVFNLNDRRQRRIVRHGSSPSWSPDARKLAFVRGNDLWVLELAGKKERRLVRNGGLTRWSTASWSPDGRQIAFSSCRDCFIFVVRSDGTKRRRLFRGANPVWSPNGEEIAFVGADKRHGLYDPIMRARLDSSGRRVLFGHTGYCACGFLDWGGGAPPRRGRR